MAKKINILKGYPNGTLELSDRGHTRAKKGKGIRWKIRDRSGSNSIRVASIERIELKPGSGNIFSVVPYRDGERWRASVKKTAVAGQESDYAITWKDPAGKEYTHDPKISVMPSDNIFKELAVVAIALIAIFSIGLIFTKKGKR